MDNHCPMLVLGGTGSGVGKTSLTLGLARAFRRRGRRVQTFKVGPDFLDPTYLALASGRPCYNLDGWMTNREYIAGLVARATQDADLALIEGVMGLFDGAEADGLAGSTAEIAIWLGAPVLLVCNASAVARSLAAMVKGFAEFEREVRVVGVLANQTGSERHGQWLDEALRSAGLPPLVGAVPRGALPVLSERHLGLVSADSATVPDECLERLADAVDKYIDLPRLLALAASAAPPATQGDDGKRADISPATAGEKPVVFAPAGHRVRIGLAQDEAFHFYYPDNLDLLQACGAELVAFSPLRDAHLPADLDGLILGGGYPEEHASHLAANLSMLEDLRAFAASGRPLYAECGGLMYLARELQDRGGTTHRMAGVLPVTVRMLPRLRSLGYVEVELSRDSLWGVRGTVFRGHEFHYSEMIGAPEPGSGWEQVYRLQPRSSSSLAAVAGYQRGRVLASYVHAHFAARQELAAHFLSCCAGGS